MSDVILGLVIESGNLFLGEVDTVLSLLQGYHRWYLMVLWSCILLGVFALISHILMIVSVVKSENFGPQHIWMGVISMFMICTMLLAIVIGDELPTLVQNAAEDIAAIESGDVLSEQLYANTNSASDISKRLPEPLGGNQPNRLRNRMMDDQAGQRIELFVFDKDYDAIKQMFKDQMLIERENRSEEKTLYEVSYTPNFRLVMEIAPVLE